MPPYCEVWPIDRDRPRFDSNCQSAAAAAIVRGSDLERFMCG
jgi:hypothetical protein